MDLPGTVAPVTPGDEHSHFEVLSIYDEVVMFQARCVVGWLGGAVLLASMGMSCGGSSGKADGGGSGGIGGGGGRGTAGFPAIGFPSISGKLRAPADRDVDVLFVIDDSPSMGPLQAKLANGFPSMMNTLRAIPGGLPSLNIAVVSSDMGAGSETIAGCTGTGKAGRFQNTARGSCTATNLQAGATFISNAGGVANYTGSVEDVFRCIAPLGEVGCGFQQPFAALTRALGADGIGSPPVENQGFLRPNAFLAIVILTNRDDCSAASGVPLFDTSQNNRLADQLGPATRFRCNEFGHICNGGAPARAAPNGMVTDTVTYTNCVSAEFAGLLKTVGETAAFLQALKDDPAKQLLVASIQGPATPYQVHWRAASITDTGPWAEVTHSCTASDGTFGDPGVRNQELALQFGALGLSSSICEDTFAPLMTRIGDAIGASFAPPCITHTIAKTFGTRPECNVIAHTPGGDGRFADSLLPYCDDVGGNPPCWSMLAGQGSCTGSTLRISPDPASSTADSTSYSYQCAVCTAGVPQPARGCP